MQPPTARSPIVVAATFTATPLLEIFDWWQQRVALPEYVLRIADYNSVFPQLLRPDSDFRATGPSGLNVVLFRFEDWVRDVRAGDAWCNVVTRTAQDLVASIHKYAGSCQAPLLVQVVIVRVVDCEQSGWKIAPREGGVV